MAEVRMPRLNANDDEFVLVEWTVADGVAVMAGAVIAVVESSKAVSDIEAEEDGVLRHIVRAPASCGAGQLLGTISIAGQATQAPQATDSVPAEDFRMTRPARVLAEEHGLDRSALAALGKPLVQRADVLRLVSTAVHEADAAIDGAQRIPVTAAQRRIARTVTESHAQVPAAFTVIKVRAQALLSQVRTATADAGGFMSVTEHLVKAIADRRPDFPAFFASVDPSGEATVRPGAHVAVTFDLGRGLFLPVVSDAQKKSVRDIAAELFRFRVAAMRGGFGEAEFEGSNIALTIHTGADIVHARPIVFPGHTCALSLMSLQHEVVMTEYDTVASSPYYLVGVAYDHRLINGQAAARFLGALKEALETSFP